MPAHHQLYQGATLEEAWDSVVGPWLARATRAAWQDAATCAVLMPSRTHLSALKARLLKEGVSVAGLGFWTPGDARDHLLQHAGLHARPAVREHLHMLLAHCAEAHGGDHTARAVARDPARLLRSLDQLAAGGADTTELQFGPAEKLAERFHHELQRLNWLPIQRIDHQLAQAIPQRPVIQELLVCGFDGMHWELWPLLQACVQAAAAATILLSRPRLKAEQLDLVWIGSWEQSFGASEPAGGGTEPGPFAVLADRMENPDADHGMVKTKADILMGRDLQEQADAVVAQVVCWLAGGAVDRLGILLPGPCALGREISNRLAARGIEHFDAYGSQCPPEDATLKTRAWINLQRDFKLSNLHPFLACTQLSAPARLDRCLDDAFREVLVEDLQVVTQWLLMQNATPEQKQAATFLASLAMLPSEASLDGFIQQTAACWDGLGWSELVQDLGAQQRATAGLGGIRITRRIFLDWLESLGSAAARTRAKGCDNPLSPVQLISYTQSEGLAWSHLVMTGLNNGQWPPSFDLPSFLPADRIAEINQTALATGKQGTGHLTVKPGRGLILGPSEKRGLARRQFYNLVESATTAVALTAAMEDQDGSGRVLSPSDFLSHLYFAQQGQPLTEALVEQLHRETLRWTQAFTRAFPAQGEIPGQPYGIQECRKAYDARREEKPFGAYEFTFVRHQPPDRSIACKLWENALADPAGTWLSLYVGVEPEGNLMEGDVWPLTMGTWVHNWLRDGLGAKADTDTFVPWRHGAALLGPLAKSAEATTSRAARAYSQAGRQLPDWWRSGWAHALWLARQLARKLECVEQFPYGASEWRLPQGLVIRMGGETRLRVHGRIDLVLADGAAPGKDRRCWVFDFKTGKNTRPLSPKNWAEKARDGEGLQIALYALALRSMGAQTVDITLLTRDAEAERQLTTDDLLGSPGLWEALAQMQATGCFGMRGILRDEYKGNLQLPLCTLPLDPDLLEKKWALSHPALAEGGKEEG